MEVGDLVVAAEGADEAEDAGGDGVDALGDEVAEGLAGDGAHVEVAAALLEEDGAAAEVDAVHGAGSVDEGVGGGVGDVDGGEAQRAGDVADEGCPEAEGFPGGEAELSGGGAGDEEVGVSEGLAEDNRRHLGEREGVGVAAGEPDGTAGDSLGGVGLGEEAAGVLLFPGPLDVGVEAAVGVLFEGVSPAGGVAAGAEEGEDAPGGEGVALEAGAGVGGALALAYEVALAEDLLEGLGGAGVDDVLLPLGEAAALGEVEGCLLYTSPSPRDRS